MTEKTDIFLHIPDFITKGQLRNMCCDADGNPISYRSLRRFLGDQITQLVGYDDKHTFFGDDVIFLLQRLMPRKYGRLEENERWREVVKRVAWLIIFYVILNMLIFRSKA